MSQNSFKVDKSLLLKPQASAPASPERGQLYVNSVTTKLNYYDGSTWIELGGAGGIFAPTVATSTITGANAAVAQPATGIIELTNASLTSIQNIVAPTLGSLEFILINRTGVDVTVLNNGGGTTANQITTGTQADITLSDRASLWLAYSANEARWMVIGGSGSGSGSGSGIGDDLGTLPYQADFFDTFTENAANANSAVNAVSATNAVYNSGKKIYQVSYDASKTVTATGTAATLSGTPAFTVAIGDMLINTATGEARKIATVTNQTTYVLEAAFTTNPSAAAACVSQAVHTKDIYNLPVDGSALSAAFGSTTFGEVLVKYLDNATSNSKIYTPGVAPAISWVASQNNSAWTTKNTRPTLETTPISGTGLPAAGTALYLRFFSSATSGSGIANLIAYRAFIQREATQNGPTGVQNSAIGFTVAGSYNNATVSVVGGKTRITLGWTYAMGVAPGQPTGGIDVYLNGQYLPRYISSAVTPNSSYTEVSGNVIDLDKDYTLANIDFEVTQYSIYVDTSTTNTTRITALESKNSGVFNYIGNADAEQGITGYQLFTDTAGVQPVNGAGTFTTGLSFGRSTTSPLRGTASFQLSKDAANRQGQGLNYQFSIDNTDKTRSLQVSFDYSGSGAIVWGTGTGAIGDVQVWLYDVTNSVLIQPSSYLLDGSGRYNGVFQASATGAVYRLIMFVGSTNASAWILNFDNVSVSYQKVPLGVPSSDEVTYPMVIGGSTTAPTKVASPVADIATWRRVGNQMVIRYDYAQGAAGSGGSGTYLYPLPAGYSIDLTKVTAQSPANTASGQVVGHGQVGSSQTTNTASLSNMRVLVASATQLMCVSDGSASANIQFPHGSTNYSFGSGALFLSFEASVPIQGWSSNTVMSTDTDTRVLAAIATIPGATSQPIGSNTSNAWNFSTKVADTHGGFSTALGGTRYTATVPGFYEITLTGYSSSSSCSIYVSKNAASSDIVGTATVNTVSASTYMIQLNVGDFFHIYGDVAIVQQAYRLSVKRLSGPAQIAASESINASYYVSSGSGVATSPTQAINFDSKEFDSHGAVTTSSTAWRFTAPAPGTYNLSVMLGTTTNANGQYLIYKNGSSAKPIVYIFNGNNNSGSTLIKLLQGEYIDVRSLTSTVVIGAALNTSVNASNISISRVGN